MDTEVDASTPTSALSEQEGARLHELEQVIEQGLQTFRQVGEALLEIRDRRLYRAEHSTFEAYLAARWGMARRTGYTYIEAAHVAASVPTSAHLTLSLAAELAKLAPEEQRQLAGIVAGMSVKEARALIRDHQAAIDAKGAAPERSRRA